MRISIILIISAFLAGLVAQSIYLDDSFDDNLFHLRRAAQERRIEEQPVVGLPKSEILRCWGKPSAITHPATGTIVRGSVHYRVLSDTELWWYDGHIFEFKKSSKCTSVMQVEVWH